MTAPATVTLAAAADLPADAAVNSVALEPVASSPTPEPVTGSPPSAAAEVAVPVEPTAAAAATPAVHVSVEAPAPAPTPATAAAAVVASAANKEDLEAIVAQAGLQWVQTTTSPESLPQVPAEVPAPRTPRRRKARTETTEEPLVQVETRP
jgi:ribonuclease E